MKFEIEDGIEIPEEKGLNFQEFYDLMPNQKYRLHYERLVYRAQNRSLSLFSEKHHVIPKCLGGTNAIENYAYLTPEEHYVAHQLLCKIFYKNQKLIFAANMMSLNKYGNRGNNKLYGWLRKEFNEASKNKSEETRLKMSNSAKVKIFTEEHRKNMGLSRKNKPRSLEAIEKMKETFANRTDEQKLELFKKQSELSTGRLVSEESKEKISKALKGRKRKPFTEETRLKMSIAFTGRKISDEHKASVANSNKNRVYTQEMRDKKSASMKANHALRKALKLQQGDKS